MNSTVMTEQMIEYRAKHKRCSYCENHHQTPCGSIRCFITGKCVWPLRAVFCKYYSARQDGNYKGMTASFARPFLAKNAVYVITDPKGRVSTKNTF